MTSRENIKIIQVAEQRFSWINIENPSIESLFSLKKTHRFHQLDLENSLNENQRSKTEFYTKYAFGIFHIPYSSNADGDIINHQITFFISPKFVITIHKGLPLIENIFTKVQKGKLAKEAYLSKGPYHLLYMLFNDLFEHSFDIIDSLSNQIEDIEVEVFTKKFEKDRLRDILLLKKHIINFRRIILPQRAILMTLGKEFKKMEIPDIDLYFDDIVDKVEKIWNNLENLQELIISVQDTNESIISHNTNRVVKNLTLLSFTIMPLTFITGFFGMNVTFYDWVSHPATHVILFIFMLLLTAGIILIFRIKKWF